MAKESIPNSSEAAQGDGTTTREQRGIQLFCEKGAEIDWFVNGTFSVPSRTHEKVAYTVDLRVGETGSCECPDFVARGNTCLHIYAAELRRAQLLAIARKEAEERKKQAEKRKGERIVVTPEQSAKLIAALDRMIS